MLALIGLAALWLLGLVCAWEGVSAVLVTLALVSLAVLGLGCVYGALDPDGFIGRRA